MYLLLIIIPIVHYLMITNIKVYKLVLSLIPAVGIYTNTCYDIFGIMWFNRLHGVLLKSLNSTYNKGDIVNWPKYHIPTDEEPQFKLRSKNYHA